MSYQFSTDHDIKQEYLSSKPTATARSDYFIIRSVDEYESLIGKPIYDMDYEELREMIAMQFANSSEGSIRRNVSVIKTYVDFCIKRNLVIHGENRLAVFSADDINDCISYRALLMKFTSRETLREYQKVLCNEQDQLILELAYIGVGGKEHEELVNLTMRNVDEEKGMISLISNDGSVRILYVDVTTIGMIGATYEQSYYMENNGMMTKNKRILSPRNSMINKVDDYVFRVPGKDKFDIFNTNLVGSRISRFKTWLDNPYLTYTSLRESGMIQRVIDVYNEKGDVGKEDYMDICDKCHYGAGKPDTYWYNLRRLFERYRKILRL